MYSCPTMGTRTGSSALVVAIGLALAGCGGSGHTSAKGTLALRATRTSFTRIPENGPGSSPGNSFVSSSRIAGGGHEDAYCVISERAHTDLCSVTVVLPRGQLSAEGVFVDAPKLSGTIALLSGTGPYDGVIGSLATSGLIDRNQSITIRLG
jgi:hypothetical protein